MIQILYKENWLWKNSECYGEFYGIPTQTGYCLASSCFFWRMPLSYRLSNLTSTVTVMRSGIAKPWSRLLDLEILLQWHSLARPARFFLLSIRSLLLRLLPAWLLIFIPSWWNYSEKKPSLHSWISLNGSRSFRKMSLKPYQGILRDTVNIPDLRINQPYSLEQISLFQSVPENVFCKI